VRLTLEADRETNISTSSVQPTDLAFLLEHASPYQLRVAGADELVSSAQSSQNQTYVLVWAPRQADPTQNIMPLQQFSRHSTHSAR
jgi:hypothetical protein